MPLTEYHDQRHYANGLEYFSNGDRWWSRLYGPTTDDDSIFKSRRDADGNSSHDPSSICGERGSYHDGILPFEATVSGPLQESAVRAGGSNISISLKNDTWVDAGFDAQRQLIIDGLKTSTDSAWNSEVISQLRPDNVVRESKSTVKISLVAAPNYDIAANESVAVNVPASALTENIKDLKAANGLEIIAETQSSSSSNSAINSTQKSGGSGSTGPLSLVILLLVAGLIRFRRRNITRLSPI